MRLKRRYALKLPCSHTHTHTRTREYRAERLATAWLLKYLFRWNRVCFKNKTESIADISLCIIKIFSPLRMSLPLLMHTLRPKSSVSKSCVCVSLVACVRVCVCVGALFVSPHSAILLKYSAQELGETNSHSLIKLNHNTTHTHSHSSLKWAVHENEI